LLKLIDILEEELKARIIRNNINLNFHSILGSAFKKGVYKMMNKVHFYLPKPTEITNSSCNDDKDCHNTLLAIDNKKPFIALTFKLEVTKLLQVICVRIYHNRIRWDK